MTAETALHRRGGFKDGWCLASDRPLPCVAYSSSRSMVQYLTGILGIVPIALCNSLERFARNLLCQ